MAAAAVIMAVAAVIGLWFRVWVWGMELQEYSDERFAFEHETDLLAWGWYRNKRRREGKKAPRRRGARRSG